MEHWYPRNPSNGTFDKWEDGVDRFGNLCLIQRNVNSKFSNMDPVSKKNTGDDRKGKPEAEAYGCRYRRFRYMDGIRAHRASEGYARHPDE